MPPIRSALAAIEGVQIPGWGGYDYSLLVDAVDVMEVHDLPLAHSLNPRLVTLTTSFGERAAGHPCHLARSAGWQPRHLILWDSEARHRPRRCDDWASKASPTPKPSRRSAAASARC